MGLASGEKVLRNTARARCRRAEDLFGGGGVLEGLVGGLGGGDGHRAEVEAVRVLLEQAVEDNRWVAG